MKAASVKTGRDNGSFSNIRLTECQEALSERQFGKQNMTCFVWSWRSCTKCWYWSLFQNQLLWKSSIEMTRAGPEYSIILIFVWWVDIQISILRFEYSFFCFFYTWHPPRNGSHSRLNMNLPWVNVMIQFVWRRRQKCRRPPLCGSTLNWVRTRQWQCAKYAIWNWPKLPQQHIKFEKSPEFCK